MQGQAFDGSCKIDATTSLGFTWCNGFPDSNWLYRGRLMRYMPRVLRKCVPKHLHAGKCPSRSLGHVQNVQRLHKICTAQFSHNICADVGGGASEIASAQILCEIFPTRLELCEQEPSCTGKSTVNASGDLTGVARRVDIYIYIYMYHECLVQVLRIWETLQVKTCLKRDRKCTMFPTERLHH